MASSPRPAGGRPERPLAGTGPLIDLAQALRDLRESSGLTYRQLGHQAHYSATALSRAAAGERKPSWDVVKAFVVQLDGDLNHFRTLWSRVDEPVEDEGELDDGSESPSPGSSSAPRPSAPPSPPSPRPRPRPLLPPVPRPASTASGSQSLSPRHSVNPGVSRLTRRNWLIIVLTTLLAVASTIFVQFTFRSVENSPSNDPLEATITSPQGPTASHIFDLAGEFTGELVPGTLIWAATFSPGNHRYYPQDHPCAVYEETRKFDCGNYYLGSDGPDTSQYRIVIMTVTNKGRDVFLQYQLDKGGPLSPSNAGIVELPDDARPIGDLAVARTP